LGGSLLRAAVRLRRHILCAGDVKQIFQIVAYLRAGFPDLEDEPPAGTKGGPGAATTDEPDRKTRDID
jgi:hypothetical protein